MTGSVLILRLLIDVVYLGLDILDKFIEKLEVLFLLGFEWFWSDDTMVEIFGFFLYIYLGVFWLEIYSFCGVFWLSLFLWIDSMTDVELLFSSIRSRRVLSPRLTSLHTYIHLSLLGRLTSLNLSWLFTGEIEVMLAKLSFHSAWFSCTGLDSIFRF